MTPEQLQNAADAMAACLRELHDTNGLPFKMLVVLREYEKLAKKKAPQVSSAEAEAIYALYPRKIGKPRALQSIGRALKKTSLVMLKERTALYARSVFGQDTQFIPHPATWFNQERYNDDPSTWVRTNRPGAPTRTLSINELRTMRDAKERMANQLKFKYASEVALGLQWSDQAKRSEYVKLRQEMRAIDAQISNARIP